MRNTFCKAERLNSKLIIDKLFAGGNSSFTVFPLRVVYMKAEKTDCKGMDTQPPVSILISVPKKRFHNAVDRNRMKRLVRESYRLNKSILWNPLQEKDYRLMIAFICLTDSMPEYKQVEKSVVKIMNRIADKI
ncbi:MAG: ribonuclease P protein component [Bacteroidaceae bacterium]|nr:ribonuclease P protein component [Bacteroidaceae bacterium]